MGEHVCVESAVARVWQRGEEGTVRHSVCQPRSNLQDSRANRAPAAAVTMTMMWIPAAAPSSAIPLFRKHWDRGGAIEGVLVDLRIERFSVPQRRPKAKPPAAPRAFRRPQPAGGAASTTRGTCGNKRPAGLSERCAVTAACHHHRAPRPDLVVSRASAARSLWCAAANGRGAGMARWG
jgi:hypothetical protein